MNTLLLYYQRLHKIDDKMLWKNAAIHQECFMRDTVGAELLHTHVFKIGQHRSKSIELPVYGIPFRNGVKMILSYNFHDWVVSVELPDACPTLPTDLFVYGGERKVPYYYGFEKEWQYDCYKPDCTKFSVEIDSEYKVYTLAYLLNRAFPDKVLTDSRGPKEIAESINEIYKANGVYDLRNRQQELGLSKPCMSPTLSPFEVLWHTQYSLEQALQKCYLGDDILMNPEVFADYICKHPEVKETFLIEESTFRTVF